MQLIFSFLASAVSLYSILIFIRIIISWFGGMTRSRPVELLSRITDPYLDWWRRTFNLRIGILDMSPLLGIVALSIFRTIFNSLAHAGNISIGNILGIVLISLWSIAAFILGFCMIIMVLRLIAYATSRDMYSPFWRFVDSVSQPILYRINRIVFGNKITHYTKGIIVSIAILLAIWIVGGMLIPMLARFLYGSPI